MPNANLAAVLEQSVGNENPVVVSKTRGKGHLKTLLFAGASFLAFVFVAHLIWVFSGSNRWELVAETNGMKIYTLKAPGADLVQAKGVFQVHATLGSIVKFMLDPDTCKDVGCYEARIVERVDDHLQYDYFRMNLPGPFTPRDFAIRKEVYQSPRTKEVVIQFAAAPGKVPLNECCVRVTNMYNTWRLVPIDHGQIQVEFTMNMNEGGWMPNLLINMAHPKIVSSLNTLQDLLDKEKYKNANLDFIEEK